VQGTWFRRNEAPGFESKRRMVSGGGFGVHSFSLPHPVVSDNLLTTGIHLKVKLQPIFLHLLA